MANCKVCGSGVVNYYCSILNDNICTNCCSSFQLCKLEKWDQLLENDYDRAALSENCFKCEGLTRNIDEDVEVEGSFMQYSFGYGEKYIFNNDLNQLFFLKKKALFEQIDELDTVGIYELADCYYHLGNTEQAIKLLEQIVERNELLNVPLLLGKVYKKIGNYDEAEKNFNKVLQLDNSNSEAYRELGNVYQLQEDNYGSIHFFNQALKNLNFDDGGINDAFFQFNYIGLAVSYSKLEKFDEVINSANSYLEHEPKWEDLIEMVTEHREGKMHYTNLDSDIYAHSTLYHLMAISYLGLNNLDIAEQYIDRAIKLNSDNTLFAKVKGIIIGRKYGQGKIDQYKKELQTAKAFAEICASSITTLKSLSPNEQVIMFTGNNNESVQNFLVKMIFNELRKVVSISSHITPSTELAADEDKYTDLLRTQMSWWTEMFGWTIHTQSRGGFTREVTGVRGGIGERDVVIKSQNDKDLMVIEALILRGVRTANIQTHTEKPFGYDIQSSNYHMIINWGFATNPDDVWAKYKEIVTSRTEGYFPVIDSGELEEIIPSIDKQSLRTFYTYHSTDQDSITATVIHVYVDIYNHMRRVMAGFSRNK